MKESKQVTIGENKYTIHNMDAIKSYKNLTKLMKLVGGPLGGAAKSESLEDIDFSVVLTSLTQNLDTDEAHELVLDFVGRCEYKGKQLKGQIQTHFAGNVENMIELFVEVIRFEYENVFQRVVGAFQGQVPAAKQVTKSRNT